MSAESENDLGVYSQESYHLELCLTKEIYEDSDYSLHEALPKAIMQHINNGDPEFLEIFSIREPCRLLNEGYEFENGVVAEDFAISGSYNGGEMVIGQLVSSDSKESYGGKPRDFIQAEYFEQQLSLDKSIGPTIKDVLSVRTTISDEDVAEEEEKIEEVLREEEEYSLDIVVHELDTEASLETMWFAD